MHIESQRYFKGIEMQFQHDKDMLLYFDDFNRKK